MATRNNENAAAAIATPIVCTEGSYEGKPTLAIGPEGGRFNWNLSAGPAKWSRVFSVDADGDSNALNVVRFLQEHSEDFAATINGADEFVRQYLAWRAEYLDSDNMDVIGNFVPEQVAEEPAQEEAVEEPSEVEAPALAPMSQGARRHFTGLLAQMPIWETGGEEQQNALVEDVYSIVQHGGVKWTDAKAGLANYKTMTEYFASSSK